MRKETAGLSVELLGVWAQIHPLAHFIHAYPCQTALKPTVTAQAFVPEGSHRPEVCCRSTCSPGVCRHYQYSVQYQLCEGLFCSSCWGIDTTLQAVVCNIVALDGVKFFWIIFLRSCVQVCAAQSPPKPHKSCPDILFFSNVKKTSNHSRLFPACASFLTTAQKQKKEHEITWFAAF